MCHTIVSRGGRLFPSTRGSERVTKRGGSRASTEEKHGVLFVHIDQAGRNTVPSKICPSRGTIELVDPLPLCRYQYVIC